MKHFWLALLALGASMACSSETLFTPLPSLPPARGSMSPASPSARGDLVDLSRQAPLSPSGSPEARPPARPRSGSPIVIPVEDNTPAIVIPTDMPPEPASGARITALPRSSPDPLKLDPLSPSLDSAPAPSKAAPAPSKAAPAPSKAAPAPSKRALSASDRLAAALSVAQGPWSAPTASDLAAWMPLSADARLARLELWGLRSGSLSALGAPSGAFHAGSLPEARFAQRELRTQWSLSTERSGQWSWSISWTWDPALGRARLSRSERETLLNGQRHHLTIDWARGQRRERVARRGAPDEISACSISGSWIPQLSDLSEASLRAGAFEPPCSDEPSSSLARPF